MTLYINVTQIDKLPSNGYLIVQGSRAGLLSAGQVGSSHKFNPPFLVKCSSDDILTFKVVKDLKAYENNDIVSAGIIHCPVLTKRYRNQLIGTFVPPPTFYSTIPNTQTMGNSTLVNPTYSSNINQPIVNQSGLRQSGINQSNTYVNQPTVYQSGVTQSNVNYQPNVYQSGLSQSNINTPHSVLPYQVELFSGQQKSAGIIYCTITYDRVSYFQGEFCTAAQRQALKRGQKVAMFKGKCPTKNLFSMIDPACDGQQFKFVESIYKDGEETYTL